MSGNVIEQLYNALKYYVRAYNTFVLTPTAVTSNNYSVRRVKILNRLNETVKNMMTALWRHF